MENEKELFNCLNRIVELLDAAQKDRHEFIGKLLKQLEKQKQAIDGIDAKLEETNRSLSSIEIEVGTLEERFRLPEPDDDSRLK